MSNEPKPEKLSDPKGCFKHPTLISDNAMKLILDYEVGGGKNYYNKYLSKPTWPGYESGITIGIGFDLGYNELDPWFDYLPTAHIARLSEARGKKGKSAKYLVSKFSNIRIPWDAAFAVFKNHTLPEQIAKTRKTFPGMEELPEDVQGVLVSLVFNRGTSMTGNTRKEMRDVRKFVAEKDLCGIANSILKMKRLWVGKGVDGLLARRDAEAELVLKSMIA